MIIRLTFLSFALSHILCSVHTNTHTIINNNNTRDAYSSLSQTVFFHTILRLNMFIVVADVLVLYQFWILMKMHTHAQSVKRRKNTRFLLDFREFFESVEKSANIWNSERENKVFEISVVSYMECYGKCSLTVYDSPIKNTDRLLFIVV